MSRPKPRLTIVFRPLTPAEQRRRTRRENEWEAARLSAQAAEQQKAGLMRWLENSKIDLATDALVLESDDMTTLLQGLQRPAQKQARHKELAL